MIEKDDIPAKSFWELVWRRQGWGPILVMAAALTAMVISFGLHSKASRFERFGIVATAQVTGHRTEERRSSDGTTSTDYFATFAFEADQRSVRQERKISRARYFDTKSRRSVQVRYLPGRVHGFEEYVGQTRDSGKSAGWIGFGLGCFAFVLAWILYHRFAYGILARRFGRVGRGYVLSIDKRGSRKNRYYVLVWKTIDGPGGESWHASSDDFMGLKPGDPITVFMRKGKSYWRGDVGGRPARRSKMPRVTRD